jgi:hypothetical protein
MKLERENVGMYNLFKYAIKFYLNILLGVECLETFFNTYGSFTFGAPKHCILPSRIFITHYTPLCWPGLFFCRGILSGKCLPTPRGIFLSVE